MLSRKIPEVYLRTFVSIAEKTWSKLLPKAKEKTLFSCNNKMPMKSFEYGMGACCSVNDREISPDDAYVFHPTILDASFHLGTTLDNGGHKAIADHGTMIPASLAAYTHVSTMPNMKFDRLWTSVGNLIKEAHDAAISSYEIRRGNEVAEASVTDLLAKPMRGPYRSIHSKHEQLKYTLQWKAVDAFTNQSRDKYRSRSHHVAWQKVSGVGRLLWQANSKLIPLSPRSTAMSLQTIANNYW